MTVRATSLAAYDTVDLSARQAEVLEAARECFLLLGAPFSDTDLAKLLNWPINRITPRRGELVKRGYIEEAGEVLRDGRHVIGWKPRFKPIYPVEADGQLSLVGARAA